MTPGPGSQTRRLILLGSTGSIGVSTLQTVAHLADTNAQQFEIAGLATGSRAEDLAHQARVSGTQCVALADPSGIDALSNIRQVHVGPEAATQLVNEIGRPGDLVVAAMVGSAGLPPVLAAIERGCDIALANKETLVAAGDLVIPLARDKGVSLLPVDSEHSAIFQCLRGGRSRDEIKRIILTASGGPFRTWTRQQIDNATVDEALNHPTWNMGPKITIDSATLMNKALEVIEAHWLFGLPAERIDVLVHPQSIIHGMVEFTDGSVIAQLGPPDMRTPIQLALTWPHRRDGCSRTMNWRDLRRLDFEPVDEDRFGSIGLARRVIEAEGTSGAILNAANEEAVAAFLDGRIGFTQITRLVEAALDTINPGPIGCLADVMDADASARRFVAERIMEGSGGQKDDRLAGRLRT